MYDVIIIHCMWHCQVMGEREVYELTFFHFYLQYVKLVKQNVGQFTSLLFL